MPLRPRRRAPRWAPEPPVPLPPGTVVHVPGRGELFVRDTGGDGPPLLLLHGWTATADLNWFHQYEALAAAGYRAIALDHRGHGRGLRTFADFRLHDCADDAVALAEHLGLGPVTAVGYSMGGPIALLAARRHPAAVAGIVLCATSSNWRALRMRGLWWSMAAFRLALGVAPHGLWRWGLRAAGMPDTAETTWVGLGARARHLARHRRGRALGDSTPARGSARSPSRPPSW